MDFAYNVIDFVLQSTPMSQRFAVRKFCLNTVKRKKNQSGLEMNEYLEMNEHQAIGFYLYLFNIQITTIYLKMMIIPIG